MFSQDCLLNIDSFIKIDDLIERSRMNKKCLEDARQIFKMIYSKTTIRVAGPFIEHDGHGIEQTGLLISLKTE